MNSFEWIDATSVEQAVALLGRREPAAPVVAKAGGIDLIDLMKEGIVAPGAGRQPPVDRRAATASRSTTARGLRSARWSTLAQIAVVAEIRAALSGARGRGRPRRDAAGAQCRDDRRQPAAAAALLVLPQPATSTATASMQPRRSRAARTSITRSSTTPNAAMVHASTPATALVAYGAQVHLTASRAARADRAAERVPAAAATSSAIATRRSSRDEVLTHVIVPPPAAGTRAAYHKQTERDSYDWPICDVAVVLPLSEAQVRTASIVLGAGRADSASRDRERKRCWSGGKSTNVCRRSRTRRRPRCDADGKNGYKVPVLEAVVRRTILARVTPRLLNRDGRAVVRAGTAAP